MDSLCLSVCFFLNYLKRFIGKIDYDVLMNKVRHLSNTNSHYRKLFLVAGIFKLKKNMLLKFYGKAS